MKKILFTIIILSALLFNMSGVMAEEPGVSVGVDNPNGPAPGQASTQVDYTADVANQLQAMAGEQGANYGKPNDPRLVVANIIKIVLSILGLLTVAFIVYAGVTILLSHGDEEKITKGKNTLRDSVIGLLIILSAYGILALAIRLVTGNCFGWDSGCFDWFKRYSDGSGATFDWGVQDRPRTNPDPYAEDFYPGEKGLFDPTQYQGPYK